MDKVEDPTKRAPWSLGANESTTGGYACALYRMVQSGQIRVGTITDADAGAEIIASLMATTRMATGIGGV